jgi:membrane protein implicated in regulation of membrane protease activity
MKPTASKLICWSGLAALVAGLIFAGIQPIHPPDVVASVTTGAWAVITPLKTAMCLLFLIGITGIYARQVKEAGWLGLAGFLLLIVCWWLQTAFVFAEAFIAPPLASVAPKFVDGYLGISYGHTGGIALGALPALYFLVGILYMLGGLLFGIATFRAGILPRWAGGLLAVTAALTPLAALLPHDIQRLAAMPMGLALAWLGYALWSERREQAAEPDDDGVLTGVGQSAVVVPSNGRVPSKV